MKFRMTYLGYRSTPNYPYDYRIELIEYHLHEREQLTDWLADHNIKHTTTGWLTGSVIYMQAKDANLFAMKWVS